MRIALCAAALLGAAAANTAVAMEEGDWLIRFGVSNVDPKSDNNPLVSVDSAASATFNFTYMMTRHWAVEVLAAWPQGEIVRPGKRTIGARMARSRVGEGGARRAARD
jgi:outer membrane protein